LWRRSELVSSFLTSEIEQRYGRNPSNNFALTPGASFLKLFYCPTCTRVYYLPKELTYLCGRNHATAVWKDGKMRRFAINEKTASNQPPWPIPGLTEEVEMHQEDFSECWLKECMNPEDTDFGDYRRHFSQGTLGARHLTRDEVMGKYANYVLLAVTP
jgi:hypothetical protein